MKKSSTSQESHEDRLREINEAIARIKSDNTINEGLNIPKPKWHHRIFKKRAPPVTAEEFTPPRDRITNIKDRFMHQRSWLIHMQLRQGGSESFIINTNNMEFEYSKGMYIIDSSLARHNKGCGLYELFYHQDFCLPFSANINAKELQDAVIKYGTIADLEVECNTNPMELKKWEEGKIAEQAFKGSTLSEFLRMLSLKTWIILALVAILFILFVAKTGMLKSIPGLGG